MFLFNKKIDLTKAINEEKGIFAINGELNNAVAYDLIKKLFAFSDNTPNEAITLYINSNGGSLTAGMAIYDTLKALPNEIKTIGFENVSGIGLLILAGGTKGLRFAHSKTKFTLGQFYANLNLEQIPPEIFSAIEKVFIEIEKNTEMTLDEIKEMSENKLELNLKMALELGIIDEKF